MGHGSYFQVQRTQLLTKLHSCPSAIGTALPQVKAPKPAAPKAASQANGAAAAAAPDEEAWRTADPFAFLPRPPANNIVHTSVHFRCLSSRPENAFVYALQRGRCMRCD